MTTRRKFLKTLGGVTLLTIVPRNVLGNGMLAPSDELDQRDHRCGRNGSQPYSIRQNTCGCHV